MICKRQIRNIHLEKLLLRVEEELSAIHLRLARVYIENKHYEDLIPCFDRPDTFFYLDPVTELLISNF